MNILKHITLLLILTLAGQAHAAPTCWRQKSQPGIYDQICFLESEYTAGQSLRLKGTLNGSPFMQEVHLSELSAAADPYYGTREGLLFFEKKGRSYCQTEIIEVYLKLTIQKESGWLKEMRPSLRLTKAPPQCRGDLITRNYTYNRQLP